jgi:hypothetical protein
VTCYSFQDLQGQGLKYAAFLKMMRWLVEVGNLLPDGSPLGIHLVRRAFGDHVGKFHIPTVLNFDFPCGTDL